MEYHKINTLFERDEKFFVKPDKLRAPVLGTISVWDVTEKIDGTNIRITLTPDGKVTYGGRTDNAQLHKDLVVYFGHTFTPEKMKKIWINEPTKVVLYGEGYGAGIQKGGGNYRHDKSFRLFDVLVDDNWWLERPGIEDIAAKLEIKTVPYIGQMSIPEIVNFVSRGYLSIVAMEDSGQDHMAEGVVARPIATLFDRKGDRVIIKLKNRDFAH